MDQINSELTLLLIASTINRSLKQLKPTARPQILLDSFLKQLQTLVSQYKDNFKFSIPADQTIDKPTLILLISKSEFSKFVRIADDQMLFDVSPQNYNTIKKIILDSTTTYSTLLVKQINDLSTIFCHQQLELLKYRAEHGVSGEAGNKGVEEEEAQENDEDEVDEEKAGGQDEVEQEDDEDEDEEEADEEEEKAHIAENGVDPEDVEQAEDVDEEDAASALVEETAMQEADPLEEFVAEDENREVDDNKEDGDEDDDDEVALENEDDNIELDEADEAEAVEEEDASETDKINQTENTDEAEDEEDEEDAEVDEVAEEVKKEQSVNESEHEKPSKSSPVPETEEEDDDEEGTPTVRSRKRSRSPPAGAQHKRFQNIGVNLINSIQAHRYSSPFLQAVNKRDALDYYDVIYEPKDLKSILKGVKLKGDPPTYTLIKQLERDIMLMFANCILFNKSDDALVGLTISMKNDVKNIFKMFEDAELDIK